MEREAERYLQDQGLRSLASNYRCRQGEIDLIMQQGNTLVFVEVRYRSSPSFGSAAESITRSKQKKIIAAARHYISSRHSQEPACRFDVVAIAGGSGRRVDWIRDAFQLG
jgi:putative endonuclease